VADEHDEDDGPTLSELISNTPLKPGDPDPWSVFKLLHDTLMAVDGITIGVALTASCALYTEVVRKLGVSNVDAIDILETALADRLPSLEPERSN